MNTVLKFMMFSLAIMVGPAISYANQGYIPCAMDRTRLEARSKELAKIVNADRRIEKILLNTQRAK